MSKQTKNQTPPSVDTIKEWVKKDIESAIYLLSFVRHRHPDVLDNMAKEIHAKAMKEEQGQAIEHLTKKQDAIA